MNLEDLSSITGVITFTMAVVELLKAKLKGVRWFECVPVWVYTVLVAEILTYLASTWIVIDGHPVLQGQVHTLLWRAALAAGSASGFYTWLRKPETVKAASTIGDPHEKGPC